MKQMRNLVAVSATVSLLFLSACGGAPPSPYTTIGGLPVDLNKVPSAAYLPCGTGATTGLCGKDKAPVYLDKEGGTTSDVTKAETVKCDENDQAACKKLDCACAIFRRGDAARRAKDGAGKTPAEKAEIDAFKGDNQPTSSYAKSFEYKCFCIKPKP
jgi:hypothetical protein